MKTKVSKRFFAYVIDIILVGLILSMAGGYIVNNDKITKLNQELNVVNEKLLKKEINNVQFLKEHGELVYQVDSEKVFVNDLNIVVIIVYFIFIPFFFNGKTVGLYLLKLKINGDNDRWIFLKNLFIRNFIINGLAYLLMSLVILHILSGFTYFITVSILGFIQFILVFSSVYMIIYRRDKQGLHDILSQTKIIVD